MRERGVTMNYGLPYQGSKNKIAEELIQQLPNATHFVDLFAGGCAMTHIALLSGKYNHYIANDITDVPQLFKSAINGEYADERRWISREDFYKLKDTDTYVRICWSFGNNGEDYMYSKEVEPWKKALHYARVFGDCSLLAEFGIESNGNRADMVKHHEEYKQKYIRWWLSQQDYTEQELDSLISTTQEDIRKTEEELRQYLLNALADSGLSQAEVGNRLGTQMQGHYFGRSQWAFPTQEYYEQMQTFMPKLDKDYNEIVGLYNLQQSLQSLQSLQRLQRLQSLESLESLQSLQSLESLEARCGDYSSVEIQPDSVIYCDIPYKGTTGYNGTEFNHEAFYKWASEQEQVVYVSEYSMPSDWVCIWRKTIRRKFSSTSASVCDEGLFVHASQLAKHDAKMRITQGRLF